MSAKIVIALDIDGVCSPFPTSLSHVDEYTQRGLVFSDEALTFLSEQINDFLRELDKNPDVEILWHTAWYTNAQTKFAKPAKLPHWELLATKAEWAKEEGIWWKVTSLQRFLKENPDSHVIWIDDDILYSKEIGEIDDEMLNNPKMILFPTKTEDGLNESKQEELLRIIETIQNQEA